MTDVQPIDPLLAHSEPVRLVAWRACAAAPAEPLAWRPIVDRAAPLHAYTPLVDRWVYHFAELVPEPDAPGHSTPRVVPLHELEYRAGGQLYMTNWKVDAGDMFEPPAARGEQFPVPDGLVPMPPHLRDHEAYSYFYVSPIRLDARATQRVLTGLEAHVADRTSRAPGTIYWLPRVAARPLVAAGPDATVPAHDMPFEPSAGESDLLVKRLCVFDPVGVAEGLAYDMRGQVKALDRLRNEPDRAQLRTLAKLVQALAQINALKLDNELEKDEAERVLSRWIRLDEEAVAAAMTRADAAAEALADWLQGVANAWLFLVQAYGDTKDGMDRWFELTEELTEDLAQTGPGRVLIANGGEGLVVPLALVRSALLIDEAKPADVATAFNISTKSHKSYLGIWQSVANVLVARRMDRADQLAKSLNRRFGQDLVEVVQDTGQVRLLLKGAQAHDDAPRVELKFKRLKLLPHWASVMTKGEVAEQYATRFGRTLAVINLGFAIKKLHDAGHASEPDALIAGVGSLISSVSAFRDVIKLCGELATALKILSCVLDMYSSYQGFDKAVGAKDYSAAVGQALVGISAVGTFVSTIVFVDTAAAAIPVAGWVVAAVLTVVAVVGYLITVTTTDSELEIFVKHCYFGNLYEDSPSDPREWSEGKKIGGSREEGGWEGDIARQLRCLFNLLAKFDLLYVAPKILKVRCGALMPGAVLRLDFELLYTKGRGAEKQTHPFRPQLEVLAKPIDGAPTVRQAPGSTDLVDTRRALAHVIEDGRSVFDVSIEWPNYGTEYPDWYRDGAWDHVRSSVSAQLHLGGEHDPRRVPSDGPKQKTFYSA